MVVISPNQLADDDELWRIADYLHGQLEVADDPLQLEQLAGRRQWVEVHLPVFLGKSQD